MINAHVVYNLVSLTYKILHQLALLPTQSMISVQSPCRTRCSSVVTIAGPSQISIVFLVAFVLPLRVLDSDQPGHWHLFISVSIFIYNHNECFAVSVKLLYHIVLSCICIHRSCINHKNPH